MMIDAASPLVTDGSHVKTRARRVGPRRVAARGLAKWADNGRPGTVMVFALHRQSHPAYLR